MTAVARSLASDDSAQQHAQGAGAAVQPGDALAEVVWLEAVHDGDGVSQDGRCGVHALIVAAKAAENYRTSSGLSGLALDVCESPSDLGVLFQSLNP